MTIMLNNSSTLYTSVSQMVGRDPALGHESKRLVAKIFWFNIYFLNNVKCLEFLVNKKLHHASH